MSTNGFLSFAYFTGAIFFLVVIQLWFYKLWQRRRERLAFAAATRNGWNPNGHRAMSHFWEYESDEELRRTGSAMPPSSRHHWRAFKTPPLYEVAPVVNHREKTTIKQYSCPLSMTNPSSAAETSQLILFISMPCQSRHHQGELLLGRTSVDCNSSLVAVRSIS